MKHSVFVLSDEGKALTPTTPGRARKLLKSGAAVKTWSKFGIFGIQFVKATRECVPVTSLGSDQGTKFEGYSVVCGNENVLNVKLDLPDKDKQVRKNEERSALRHARRFRKTRRRPARSDNRFRADSWLAPSQRVIVDSRLKVLRELFRIYPIQLVGLEDVRFNHAHKRWGKNFSTVEIGKTTLRHFFHDHGAILTEFLGFETQMWREHFGYDKCSNKAADQFEAHCSDALALALAVLSVPKWIEPGPFLTVDDTYRPVRRRLHDTQPAKGGKRAAYSRGNVFGLRKGLLIGTSSGKIGRLCGEYKGAYRYYDAQGKRQVAKRLAWISSQFIVRKGGEAHSPVA